ncbi:MAG: hypothetical protein ACTSSG_14620, partial [Candidatus Heimdallarchaeaceae archaeon]
QIFVENLFNFLNNYKGECELYLHLTEPGNGEVVILSHKVKVDPSMKLLTHLKKLYGDNNVWVEG